MADNISFHNPQDIGSFDIAVNQLNKLLPFTSLAGVFIAESVVNVYNGTTLVKSYTIGDGLAITGTNEAAQSKTLTLTISGTDYTDYKGVTLTGKCTFFVDGDIEITFDLKIIKE